MKFVTTKKKENYLEKIVAYLEPIESKYHSHILNGTYQKLATWSMTQELLFYDDNLERTLSALILKYGLDFNIRTKKGVSFFHLYLLLLFYHDSYRTEESINYFIYLLNFGILPNHLMIFNSTKIYSMLDMLYLLQNKKSMLNKYFFPKKLSVEYKKLNIEIYNKLYLILLCKNEKFHRITLKDDIPKIHSTTIHNMNFSNDEYHKILLDYVLNLYNLPSSTPIDIIKKNVLYLYSNIEMYNEWIQSRQFPLGCSEYDTNFIFINPDFMNNAELQNETFLNPIENKFRFHRTFLWDLIRTKINPYTRNKIDEKTLKEMIEIHIQKKYIFPISSIPEAVHTFPFIFNNLYTNDKDMIKKNIISYVESFFNINHPYNQIHTLCFLLPFEIQYLSYTMKNETHLFPKFQECYNHPNTLHLFKILLHYCRNKSKFLNVIYFFLEEIIQDLQCYKKIKPLLDDFENNYNSILSIYFSRFQINNNHYLDKFMKNIYIIKKFDS